MKNAAIKNVVSGVSQSLRKHTPEILTGFGVAGMLTTTVLAVKSTPKALILLEERKKELETETLPAVETVKTTWKCYIPAAVTFAASAACLIGASKVSARRYAVLTTAYKLSEAALVEYKDKVVQTIGEKKEKVVREAIHEDRIKKDKPKKSEVLFTGKGDSKCYDMLSGRYFRCSIDTMRRAENELNSRLISDMYISLNEFYNEIGLEDVRVGDIMGWNICNGKDGFIKLDFDARLDDDGEPCVVVDYLNPPKHDFSRL